MYCKKVILAIIFLYFAALAVRLNGINAVGPHPDELLWNSRAYQVYKRVLVDPRHYTSHLPHPGLPTSLLVAFGHAIREKFSNVNCKPSDACYVDPIKSGRIVMSVGISLFFPLFFILLIPYFGKGLSFVTSLLLLLDPRFLAYSRLIHIDAMLTVFFTLGLLIYFKSVQQNSLRLKFTSGAMWALCLLCKPPGALLLPILVLYRTLRKILLGFKARVATIDWINWSDVWNIVVAHLVCILLFTRLWDLESGYISRLGVRSPTARKLLNFSLEIQEHWLIINFAIILLILLVFSLYKRYLQNQGVALKVILHSVALITVASFFYFNFPVIVRNLILYWKWVAGLTNLQHNSFGVVLNEETAVGYPYIFLTELPEEIVIGFILGLIILSYKAFNKSINEHSVVLATIALTPLIFTTFLQLSSKQDLRYMFPVFPCIYAVACYSWFELVKYLARNLATKNKIIIGFFALFTFFGLFRLYSWYPFYPAYFNNINGGLKQAHVIGRSYAFLGDVQIADYFLENRQEMPNEIYLTVAGDTNATKKVFEKVSHANSGLKFRFGWFAPEIADYYISYPSHYYLIDKKFADVVKNNKAEFAVSFKGEDIVRLHNLPYANLDEPYIFNIVNSSRLTGKIDRQSKSIVASSRTDKPGYVFFTAGPRVQSLEYVMEVIAQASLESSNNHDMELQIELAGVCHATKKVRLVPKENKVFISCKADKPGRLSPKIYWEGGYDLAISSVVLRKS